MGKATGFLEYARKENVAVSPTNRAAGFSEFHTQLPQEERRTQASRCMACGVPMCQSALQLKGMVTGCPLHNLIPEWNDALYHGLYEEAFLRLSKTSSFPEFTSRVCPALCEKACNCALDDEAVTIRDNELFIIETAFERGFIKPRIPPFRTDKKIAVIGSGPAGLAAADLLNRRGHNVTVYERDDRPGGLLMYGIPNMKLEKPIVQRRIALMEEEGVRFITGADVGRTADAAEILEMFDAVALCCGAKAARPLQAEGAGLPDVFYAVDFLSSVTKSLLNSSLRDGAFFNPKGKHVVVVGGGDTGNDCTGTCIRLGCASVVQIEMMPCPPESRAPDNPWPQWPKTLKTDYGQEEAIAFFGADPRVYETTVKAVLAENGKIRAVRTVGVEFKNEGGKRVMAEKPGTEREIPADLVLIAAGFTGCEPYTAVSFGAELTPRGTVSADNVSYRTEAAGGKVFAAGDMRRGQSLVVWAIAEGRECAREIDRFLTGYTNL